MFQRNNRNLTNFKLSSKKFLNKVYFLLTGNFSRRSRVSKKMMKRQIMKSRTLPNLFFFNNGTICRFLLFSMYRSSIMYAVFIGLFVSEGPFHFLLLWKVYRIPYGHKASLNSIRNRKVRSNNLIGHARVYFVPYIYAKSVRSFERAAHLCTWLEK